MLIQRGREDDIVRLVAFVWREVAVSPANNTYHTSLSPALKKDKIYTKIVCFDMDMDNIN